VIMILDGVCLNFLKRNHGSMDLGFLQYNVGLWILVSPHD
jgi:hypothetical protein